ncbi:MAG: LamG domain-containing protein [Verrucomicrobiales bacterium]|nr:LamG domain-containing protein [Verrucomicrobiales bacterium]
MSAATAPAAVWYLDSSAAGTKTGTSWANAWTDPAAVVWGTSGVKAGDTLYISGGSATKNYASSLAVGASGTSSAPIAIRVGQEPDHNGVAILPAISINTRQWIQIDGSRNPSFVPPTSVWQIESIAGNLGLRLTSTNSVGIYISGDGGNNNCVRYVEVGPVGSTNNIGDLNGIRFLNLNSLQNWKIEYCWIHDIQNDGINLNSVTTNPQQWDALTIRWCLIERTGDDGVQSVRNGLTLSHCFLRDHWIGLYNGHPDQLQLSGVSSAYLKVVNNIFRNKANSLIIGEQYVTEGGILGPMLIAGNVFYNTRDWVYRDIQAYGATFDAWRPNADISVASATWTNLYLLNNTVYYQRTVPFKIGRAAPDGNTRSVWQLFIKGSAIQNNILLDCGYNADQPIPVSVAGVINSTNGLFYDKTSFPLSHNAIAGKNTRVSWGGTVYANSESLNTATGLQGNTSATPGLASINDYDFRLTSADAVARNKGFNLGALTNKFPELMRDLWGNQRGLENAWDIGASEYGASTDLPVAGGGLMTRLNFSDSFADGAITDFSGHKNHGLRFGHLASPTNWPRAIAFTNPASGLIGTAASFRSYPRNGWGAYNTSGDYVAITNVNEGGLQNLTKATVALWVKRDKEPDADGDGLAEWNQDQGRYICSGFGYAGSWSMGMFTQVGAPYSYLRIYTSNSSTSDVYLRFGDGTRVVTGGGVTEGSMPWVHLAFTWDNGAVQTYFNGTPIHGTNLPLTTLTCRGPNGSLATGWIGLGCDTHNGNPTLTPYDDTGEQYPNHAWFNGALADVQIYNRVLSLSELTKVYRGEAITTDPLPEPPATPTGLRVVTQ